MIENFKEEIINEKLRLKNEIKKTSSNCAKMLLLLVITIYGLGFLISFGIKFKVMFFGAASLSYFEKELVSGISNDVHSFFIGYLPCIIGDIAAIIYAMKTTNIKLIKNIFTKNVSSKSFILLGIFSSIGTGMVSSIIYTFYLSIFEYGGITIPQPDFSFPTNKLFLILFLFYVCLLGPILEEIIFRGYILKSMQKYGNLTAVIVSSILFSLFHFNLVQFVNPILMGIIFSFITIKAKSIYPAIISHIFNNSITFLLIWLMQSQTPLFQNIFISVYSLVGIVSLILFIILYRKDFFKVVKDDKGLLFTTFEKIKYSFSGKWSIAYVIFYIVFVTASIVITNMV